MLIHVIQDLWGKSIPASKSTPFSAFQCYVAYHRHLISSLRLHTRQPMSPTQYTQSIVSMPILNRQL